MNHAIKAIAHENKIRRVANFYSAAGRRSRGALWPSFAPARIAGKELLFFTGRTSHELQRLHGPPRALGEMNARGGKAQNPAS
jgi:hypothetical protein